MSNYYRYILTIVLMCTTSFINGGIESAVGVAYDISWQQKNEITAAKYRIIIPRHRFSMRGEKMREAPPTDIGELLFEMDGKRYVYRYYDLRTTLFGDGYYNDGLIQALKQCNGIRSANIYGNNNNSTALIAAAGYDGSAYWLASPLGFKVYRSKNILNRPQQRGFRMHDWYDLALVHGLYIQIGNPGWDREALSKALASYCLSEGTDEMPIGPERTRLEKETGSLYYLFNPLNRLINDTRDHKKEWSGGLWKYNIQIDNGMPALKLCYVDSAEMDSFGPPRNIYFSPIDYLYIRQKDKYTLDSKAFMVDTYMPSGVKLEEAREGGADK